MPRAGRHPNQILRTIELVDAHQEHLEGLTTAIERLEALIARLDERVTALEERRDSRGRKGRE